MATVCYAGTSDWVLTDNNVKGYRSQDDGKFHFMFFDMDLTWENTNNVEELDANDIIYLYRNLKQNMEFNFGSALPEGYRKALRLMQLADKAKCPVITFIDTPGAYPGIGAEERHIGEAIALNLREMFRLSVPVICVVTGEGGSGGALGIAVGNRVLMQEYAYYSVITPEGCAAILWRTNDAIPKAAEALHLTSGDLLKLGVADEVVEEPNGGAHQDFPEAARLLKLAILRHLAELQKLTPEQLREDRYNRFRRLGRVDE